MRHDIKKTAQKSKGKKDESDPPRIVELIDQLDLDLIATHGNTSNGESSVAEP